MTYLAEKPTVQTSERKLITIEFVPPQDPNETEYSYEQPLFVFGDQVTKQHNSSTPFTVCGMELVEFKTPSGRLLNQPYWKYKVNNGQEQIWLNESALVRYSPTCFQCTHFQDYQESNGRAWCNLFAVAARKHHLRTNDCDLHSDSDPIDAPHASFAIESLVKIIDPQEHHTEWATFTVIARKYNTELHRSTESYLNESEWSYQLAALPYAVESFWVAENDICAFDQSHLISTEEIF
ncbi:MAG: hypothetical protein KME09_01165 [Pleurocapsa minor HA4230-MV1]|jgi:hypothetical protein|nr:hypothetical protein [Pleurocapsa minor HA4230-MV1]